MLMAAWFMRQSVNLISLDVHVDVGFQVDYGWFNGKPWRSPRGSPSSAAPSRLVPGESLIRLSLVLRLDSVPFVVLVAVVRRPSPRGRMPRGLRHARGPHKPLRAP